MSVNIQLSTTSFLTAPLHVYDNDLLFIVNGKEFKKSKIISDLLSQLFAEYIQHDLTFDVYIINMRSEGNFSHIINLCNFKLLLYDHKEELLNLSIDTLLQILSNRCLKIETDD